MSASNWYWIILILWILLGVGDIFWDDPRIRRGSSLVLIVLLVIIGFIIAGSPIK